MQKIKAVIFDLGGVLLDDPHDAMLNYYAKFFHVTFEEFAKVNVLLQSEFQTGRISENEYWQKIKHYFHLPPDTAHPQWIDGFLPEYHLHNDVFDIVKALQAVGLTTAILSNTEKPIANFIKEQHYSGFNYFIFSCDVHLNKPHKNIFLYTLEKLAVAAEDIIFIDDRIENVAAANSLGIHGIVFSSVRELKRDLLTFGLQV